MNSNPSWALFWPTEWLAYMFCSLSIFKNLWYCISYRKTKETIFPKLLRGSLCMWWKVCLLCLFLAATILNWHLVLIVFILFCYFLLFFFFTRTRISPSRKMSDVRMPKIGSATKADPTPCPRYTSVHEKTGKNELGKLWWITVSVRVRLSKVLAGPH